MFRREVERPVLKELEGRLTGLREEGERIKLHIVPLGEAWKLSPDGKLLSCLALYEKLQQTGQLRRPNLKVAPTSLHELTRQGPAAAGVEGRVLIEQGPRSARSGSDTSETPSRSSAGSDSVLRPSQKARHLGRLAKEGSRVSSRTMMKQLSKDNTEMEARIRKMQERIAALESENTQLKASSNSAGGASKEMDIAD